MQTTALAEALEARGHEVSMVVSDYDDHARTLPRRTTVPLIQAYNERGGVPGLRFVPRWRAVRRALERADAEVYFQMAAGALTGQVGGWCRESRRGFVFATASNTDVDPATARIRWHGKRLYRQGLAAAHRIVTQHRGQAEDLKRNTGLDSVPIGMTVEPVPPLPLTLERPDVLWLGNVRAVKRPHWFLDVAERLPFVQFRMIGSLADDEADLGNRVVARARSLDNVEYLGRVPNLEPHIETSGLLLNTSEVEGFPTSFLELWVHRRPVVSTFDPGGVVAERGLGTIAHDLDGLAKAVESLAEDSALREQAGERARRYVESEHAPGVVTARFEAVLGEAVEAAKANRTP